MVQPADDVQLGGAALLGLGGAFEDLLIAHHVALRRPEVGAEGTEGAAVDADVGRVEMRVDVVIGEVAVLALADNVGQLAEREEIGMLVKVNTLIEGQSLSGLYLLADLLDHGYSVARRITGLRYDPAGRCSRPCGGG